MVNKYLKVDATGLVEVEGTVTSSGSSDGGKIVALDTDGRLSTTVMPTGVGADTKSIQASENLSAGDLVNLFNDSGTLKARKADASGGVAKKADGFVLTATTTGNNAVVYFDGTITGLTGLTTGSDYYLSATTAGAVTTTIPLTTNYIAQYVGKALSATELTFEPAVPIIRA